jgi:hypothetical protein
MKIINLKIAIIESDDILDQHTPMNKLDKKDVSVNIDEDFDLILYQGACRIHPEIVGKDDKDELLRDIEKMLNTDKTMFGNLKQLKK